MLMRFNPRVVAVIVACGLLAGCGSGRSDARPAGPPSVEETRNVTSVNTLSLPVYAFKPSADQEYVLNQATVTLVNSCMARFGFASALPPARKSRPETLARRYGVTDPGIAQQYGYHVAPSEGAQADRKPPSAPLTETERLVLMGSATVGQPGATPASGGGTYAGQQIPTGGCIGEANAKLGDSAFESGLDLVNQIAHDSFARAEADPRVVAVFAKWSACMNSNGYSYADPFKAAESADLNQPEPSQAEIQTARADVACKTSANVVGVFFAVESSYEDLSIQKQIEQLKDFEKKWNDAMAAAARTIGVAPPK